MSVSVKERVELAHNAVGRKVPTMVNGKPQTACTHKAAAARAEGGAGNLLE